MLRVADITEESDLPGDFDIRQAIGLAKAREMLRGKGTPARPPAVETLRKWIREGCHPAGQGGPVLRLRAHLINGEFLVMPSWVLAFERERVRLSQVDPLADERTNRSRKADIRRAERELDKAGIGTPRGEGARR